MYRYIVRESCSQFDSLPLTYLSKALDRPRALCTEASGTPADVLVIEEAMRKVLESASHVNETIRVREQREELGALAWRFKGDVKVRLSLAAVFFSSFP